MEYRIMRRRNSTGAALVEHNEDTNRRNRAKRPALSVSSGDGKGRWDQRQFGATDLARSWSAAASRAPVQAVQRSAIRDQAQGDRRAIRRPARPCHRALGR
jgi:hypothetical protein